MTVKTAKIIGKRYKGDSEECSGPGRLVYQLQGVNCQIEDFLGWILFSQDFQDFLLCPPDLLIDIGGARKNFSEGEHLSVSFDEYFDGWLKAELADWRRTIQIASKNFLVSPKLDPKK